MAAVGMSHGRIACSCGATISQCRCRQAHVVIAVVKGGCTACRAANDARAAVRGALAREASEGDVGEFTLPPGHLFGMGVPKGGSACSKCKFVSENGKHCGSEYFQNWRKSLGAKDPSELPAPADEYCCDVFAEKT